MEFRKSVETDIKGIMNIITQAQQYFKENNIDQWQNNYPNVEVISQDIKQGDSYVLVDNGQVIATTVISFNGEQTYNIIYEGDWINDEVYAVAHRVAVDNHYKGRGIAGKMLECMQEICVKQGINSIRIDTHEDNKSMQKLLKKHGFTYCGIIYLADGNKRIAYQK